jgi:hypothetical protein
MADRSSDTARPRRLVLRLVAAVAVSAAMLALAAPVTAAPVTSLPSSYCQATPRVIAQYNGEFQSTIHLQNVGPVTWSGWTLTWRFANGETIFVFWNGIPTQTGANVAVVNMSWNGNLHPTPPGNATDLGFEARGTAGPLLDLTCTPH